MLKRLRNNFAHVTIVKELTENSLTMSKRPHNPLIVQAASLIEARTGLACLESPRIHLDTVLNELAGGNLRGYVAALRAAPDSAPEWQALMRALVIGETYFFRNRVYFDLLSTRILPDIFSRHNKEQPLNIWSAGCATGEETYSLAISLYDSLPDASHHQLRLLGTDINATALATARSGVYREWSFRQSGSAFQKMWFTPTNAGWQIKPFIRSMVEFRQGNLLSGPPMLGVHVIFCCNVLLYFEESAVRRAEDAFYNALAPGGWLVLGGAEAARHNRERWTTHIFPGAVIYQKPLQPGRTDALRYRLPPVTNSSSSPKRSVERASLTNADREPASYPDAVRLFREKRYDDADRVLVQVILSNPRSAPAYVLTACLRANRGDGTGADESLSTALRLDPLQADAHYLKGLLALERGQADIAAEALRAALYCRRGHPLAAMILGGLYVREGETARARRIWSEAEAALTASAPDAPVCDLSDITAEGVRSFLAEQLLP